MLHPPTITPARIQAQGATRSEGPSSPIIEDVLPVRSDGSPVFASGLMEMVREKNSPKRIRRLDRLPDHEFWTPNAPTFAWVIVVDVDRPDASSHIQQQVVKTGIVPSWTFVNPESRHGQVGFFFPGIPRSERAKAGPQRLLRLVRNALTRAFGGDASFTHGRCRNPFCDAYKDKVSWGYVQPRLLKDLANQLSDRGMWDPTPLPRSKVGAGPAQRSSPGVPARAVRVWGNGDAPIPVGSRNVGLYWSVRSAIDRGELSRIDQIGPTLRGIPLAVPFGVEEGDYSSLEGSLRRYVARHGFGSGGPDYLASRGGPHGVQAKRGARGGRRRTPAQHVARSRNVAGARAVRIAERGVVHDQIRTLDKDGLPRVQIRDRLGVSESTVKRALRDVPKQSQ